MEEGEVAEVPLPGEEVSEERSGPTTTIGYIPHDTLFAEPVHAGGSV